MKFLKKQQEDPIKDSYVGSKQRVIIKTLTSTHLKFNQGKFNCTFTKGKVVKALLAFVTMDAIKWSLALAFPLVVAGHSNRAVVVTFTSYYKYQIQFLLVSNSIKISIMQWRL